MTLREEYSDGMSAHCEFPSLLDRIKDGLRVIGEDSKSPPFEALVAWYDNLKDGRPAPSTLLRYPH